MTWTVCDLVCIYRIWSDYQREEEVISVSGVSVGLRFPAHTFCFWVRRAVSVSVAHLDHKHADHVESH